MKGVWKHRNCMDLEVEFLHVTYRGPSYIQARVSYWRADLGCGGFRLSLAELVTIRLSDLPNWKYLRDRP